MIQRTIGTLSFDVECASANELYFPERFLPFYREDGISGILEGIYAFNGSHYLPLSGFIELTNHCNFSCPFCYIHEAAAPAASMPRFSEWKSTLQTLVDQGLVYCTLSGGECLTHPDFMEIYRFLKSSGVLVTIFTNGYLLNEQHFSLFAQYAPFKIEISLYGTDDESYQKTVNNPTVSATKVFDNILRLTEMGIYVVCKTPITSLTEASYHALRQWCEAHQIEYYAGVEMLETYSGKPTTAYIASETIRAQYHAEQTKAFFDDAKMNAMADCPPEKKRNLDCTGGKYDFFISANNMLYPCMKALHADGWGFDLQQDGAASAFLKMKTKIEQARKGFLEHCSGCSHHKVCQECFMTQFEYTDLKTHRIAYCESLHAYITSEGKDGLSF